ncbi:MotA/TolQ/ExbB proton channel family protein [Neorhodopirellula pilleata]
MHSNPYSSPTANAHHDLDRGLLLRRIRFASGLIAPLAIVSGVVLTVIGIMRSFDALAKSENVDPSQLGGDISTSLSIGSISIPVAIVACAVWIWATLKLRKIKRSAAVASTQ